MKSARTSSTSQESGRVRCQPGQPSPGEAKQRARILVVDDDTSVCQSLREVLELEGFNVIGAGNGSDALNEIRTAHVDLVLLDLTLPGLNGWEVFERLTAEQPTLPVVVITARPCQVFTAAAAGVAALLEKPLEIPDLLQAIRSLLAESDHTRLARLAGKPTDFYYSPVISCKEQAPRPTPKSSDACSDL